MARLNGPYPEMPKGTEVGSFNSYDSAAQAVERLGEAGFPLASITIVGSDLHIAEDIVGKLTPAKVALAGATQGLAWGIAFGLMLFVLMGNTAGFYPLFGVALGVLLGIVMTVAPWALNQKKRGFASRSQLVASRYALLVSEQADLAFRLLQEMGIHAPAPKPKARRTTSSAKPEFGVRLTPEERRERDRASRPAAQPNEDEPTEP